MTCTWNFKDHDAFAGNGTSDCQNESNIYFWKIRVVLNWEYYPTFWWVPWIFCRFPLIDNGKMVKFRELEFSPQNFPIANQRESDKKFTAPTKIWAIIPNSIVLISWIFLNNFFEKSNIFRAKCEKLGFKVRLSRACDSIGRFFSRTIEFIIWCTRRNHESVPPLNPSSSRECQNSRYFVPKYRPKIRAPIGVKI